MKDFIREAIRVVSQATEEGWLLRSKVIQDPDSILVLIVKGGCDYPRVETDIKTRIMNYKENKMIQNRKEDEVLDKIWKDFQDEPWFGAAGLSGQNIQILANRPVLGPSIHIDPNIYDMPVVIEFYATQSSHACFTLRRLRKLYPRRNFNIIIEYTADSVESMGYKRHFEVDEGIDINKFHGYPILVKPGVRPLYPIKSLACHLQETEKPPGDPLRFHRFENPPGVSIPFYPVDHKDRDKPVLNPTLVVNKSTGKEKFEISEQQLEAYPKLDIELCAEKIAQKNIDRELRRSMGIPDGFGESPTRTENLKVMECLKEAATHFKQDKINWMSKLNKQKFIPDRIIMDRNSFNDILNWTQEDMKDKDKK